MNTLARIPVRFFPRLRMGQAVPNADCAFERLSQHNPAGFMPLGAYSYSHSTFEAAKIGRYCSISRNVTVMGQTHPLDWVTTSPITYTKRRRSFLGVAGPNRDLSFDDAVLPVTIGNDVWIGQDVLLKGGITIADGAVIAARAVVTRDVAPYTVVGGTPARKIKDRFDARTIAALSGLNWWQYSYDCLQHLDFSDPAEFIAKFPAASDLVVLPEARLTIFEHIAAQDTQTAP